MRQHTGEKPYECQQAGEAHRDHSSFETHKRVHTGEKSHECQECGKTSNNQRLKTHMSLHTRGKPYEYVQCGEAFICSLSFQKHESVTRETL